MSLIDAPAAAWWRMVRPALLAALMLPLAGCGGGGGGGSAAATSDTASTPAAATALRAANLAVLYDVADSESLAIARAYQQARGVPEAQVIGVSLPAGVGDAISAEAFVSVKAAIDARLPANVQATLLTWQRPSRVAGSCSMGITSALAFGYDAAYCGGCAVTRSSPYYASASHQPWTDLQMRPSMLLGARTLAAAQQLIARGVAADASWTAAAPAGAQALLVRTSDAARSVRYVDFQALAATSVPGLTMRYVDNAQGSGSDEISGQAAVMFYFTGLGTITKAASNGYLPGAIADTLTSYGGLLPDSAFGQTPITDWLQAGLTASYGTVEEPCNIADKFSRPSVLVARYKAGDTLIEAYWKAVRTPGQGLFVGEPLARPWAVP